MNWLVDRADGLPAFGSFGRELRGLGEDPRGVIVLLGVVGLLRGSIIFWMRVL
jgi:hypothetical protein